MSKVSLESLLFAQNVLLDLQEVILLAWVQDQENYKISEIYDLLRKKIDELKEQES